MKTNFDLYLGALDAAKASMSETSSRAISLSAHAAFEAGQNCEEDWDLWYSHFQNLRQVLASLKIQPTPGQQVETRRIAAAELAAKNPPK